MLGLYFKASFLKVIKLAVKKFLEGNGCGWTHCCKDKILIFFCWDIVWSHRFRETN